MLRYFLNLLFPPKCIFCNKLLPINTDIEICSNCYLEINFLPKKIQHTNSGSYFLGVICISEYEGLIKKALKEFKFKDKPHYFRTFANLAEKFIKEMTQNEKFDIILSVPLHKERQRERGYNQSYLISKAIGKRLGISEKSHFLVRKKNTKTQSLLSLDERKKNVKNAFEAKNFGVFNNKTVILVDDIMTSGNTLNECSKVLLEAGASKVVCLVIASGRNFRDR